MKDRGELKVHMIPLESISVVNGRSRGQVKFRQITTNISKIGLKKPITVARRPVKDGRAVYDLVCGQGRLEAFKALGQTLVPAMIVDVTQEELMLMSLAENMARKQRTSIEMAKEIVALHDRGQSIATIAKTVDLDPTYVRGMVRLLKHGEERLLRAVEEHRIPLSMAIEISESDDQEVQRLMAEAYLRKELRGACLLAVKRLLDTRKNKGKAMYERKGGQEALPGDVLVRVYKKETAKLQLLAKRASTTETRLHVVATAFRKLFLNEEFVELLKRESFNTLPQYLADQISGKRVSHGR